MNTINQITLPGVSRNRVIEAHKKTLAGWDVQRFSYKTDLPQADTAREWGAVMRERGYTTVDSEDRS